MTEMYASAMADYNSGMSDDILQRHYPLHWACYKGNEVYLKELLMSGVADVYQEDGLYGWTPMHWAASQGKWKCLELIRQICPIDLDVTITRLNQTVTHIAAQQGQVECIAWLVRQGISLGMQLGHRPGIHDVRSSRTGEAASHIAAREGHPECLHWLLQHSVGYAQQDFMGDTPLHKAVQTGKLECVKLLISHGPVLSTYNQKGQTPLDVATQNGHIECKACLEEAMFSQHTSFFPSASSPILMNGEGIYQNGVDGKREEECDQDMEMGEEMGSDGDATVSFQPATGCKRSFDHEEEMPFKRRRLFAPTSSDKLGTVNNNNVLSSYQGILAMSVEPLKHQVASHLNSMPEVHAMRSSSPAAWNSSDVAVSGSSSVEDHCNAMTAQHSYDSMMLNALIHESHGS